MLAHYLEMRLRINDSVTRFTRSDHGAGIVEYLLLVLFIGLSLILALTFFTGRLDAAFSRAGNSIPS